MSDEDHVYTFLTSRPPEPGRATLVRLQRHNGVDVATINLHTGKVTLVDPDHVDEAAKIFWSSVRAVLELNRGMLRDLILRAGDPSLGGAGDIILRAGSGERGLDFVVADRAR